MRRLVLAVLVCFVGFTATADAALRSPRLATSCPANHEYGELQQGPWRIEGCHREVANADDLTRRFSGVVEVNGVLMEGANDLVVVTTTTERNNRPLLRHRITRAGNSARIVLDPQVGGERRRFVIHSGAIDIESLSQIGGRPPVFVPGGTIEIKAAGSGGTDPSGTTDLPVGIGNSVLGLRLQTDINNAELDPGDGTRNDPGGMEFTARMSLGSGASALMRDYTARVSFRTVDGQGLQLSGLTLNLPDIAIPGIGGMRDLSITYSSQRDEWGGTLELDLGELFPTIEFAIKVSASSGAPTEIVAAVSNLQIPIGSSGFVLREIRGGFDTNPLVMSAGATATWGPQVGNASLATVDGDLVIRLEPSFALETEGRVRILTTGPNSELASGNMRFILDSEGYIELSGGARFEALIAGIGISAEINGSGAYSTARNEFNVSADATGRLHLGFLGSFTVARFAAVVSSDGWGTCGELAFLLKAGVGQKWDRGVRVFTGCDLGPYNAPVRRPRAAQANTQTFDVPAGVKTLAVEITAAGPEPAVRLSGPGGAAVQTRPLGLRTIARRATVLAPAGSNVQYVFVKSPPAGTYTVAWDPASPAVTGVRTARDVTPLKASVDVARVARTPGQRRLTVAGLDGLGEGETASIGVQTPSGILPIGTVSSAGGSVNAAFDEVEPGRRPIVATVVREGVPMPGRTRMIGSYAARLPGAPRTVSAKRKGNVLTLSARVARGAEAPHSWVYVVRASGKPFAVARGRANARVKITVPADVEKLTVVVRPMLKGRVLRGAGKTARVR